MDEVEFYINKQPNKRKDTLRLLHDKIIKLYPKITIDLKYKMPTYSLNEGWVAIANQKDYVSLYTVVTIT